MRPILALAILLLGLMLGLTAAVSEVKFGTTAAVQILPAKMQDRVPAVDEAQPSADVETTGSIGKSGIGNPAIRVAAVGDIDIARSQLTAPEIDAPEIKKTTACSRSSRRLISARQTRAHRRQPPMQMWTRRRTPVSPSRSMLCATR